MSGKNPGRLAGLRPSHPLFWGEYFGGQIEQIDKALDRGQRIVTYEHSAEFRHEGKSRITLRYPIRLGSDLYYASLSVAYNWGKPSSDTLNDELLDPMVELEDAALDPATEVILSRFFDEAPASLLVRVDAFTSAASSETVLYANHAARQLFGLRSTRGSCSEDLANYFKKRSGPNYDDLLHSRVTRRFSPSRDYAEHLWNRKLENPPARWVMAFDVLGGTFTKSAQASLGLCATIVEATIPRLQNVGEGIVLASRLDGPDENYPGLFKRTQPLAVFD
jgi:hypothetical protein